MVRPALPILAILLLLSSCSGGKTEEKPFPSPNTNKPGEQQDRTEVPVIRYPAPMGSRDHRENYEWTLLKEALETTREDWGDFTLEPTPHPLPKNNPAEVMLREPSRIQVIRKATSRELEQKLLPIRIPLLKGVLGYRVFITHRDLVSRFQALEDPADLKGFPILQGINWNDTAILRHNGYQVMEGQFYKGFFAMVQRKRVPLFARAVHEAPGELDTFQKDNPDLRLESRFLLVYPFYEYFFVSPGNSALAARIEEGLMTLTATGRFDEIFQEFIGRVISRGRLAERTVIPLENPYLPEIPLADDPRFQLNLSLY